MGPPPGAAGGPPTGAPPAAPLPVVSVGDFIASYVPTINDFDRLDKRFVIPKRTWAAIPTYGDYGFAVFKLKAAPRLSSVHPMAMSFATQYPGALFFPTVHIHDGKVHKREQFDHTLYMQFIEENAVTDRMPGTPPAAQFMRLDRTRGIINGRKSIHQGDLRGMLPNQDTFVPLR